LGTSTFIIEVIKMRAFLAALALAGALFPFEPARASEARLRVAQMARDVTDALRNQRKEQRARMPSPCAPVTRGSQR
jgi:hypothetical protein